MKSILLKNTKRRISCEIGAWGMVSVGFVPPAQSRSSTKSILIHAHEGTAHAHEFHHGHAAGVRDVLSDIVFLL